MDPIYAEFLFYLDRGVWAFVSVCVSLLAILQICNEPSGKSKQIGIAHYWMRRFFLAAGVLSLSILLDMAGENGTIVGPLLVVRDLIGRTISLGYVVLIVIFSLMTLENFARSARKGKLTDKLPAWARALHYTAIVVAAVAGYVDIALRAILDLQRPLALFCGVMAVGIVIIFFTVFLSGRLLVRNLNRTGVDNLGSQSKKQKKLKKLVRFQTCMVGLMAGTVILLVLVLYDIWQNWDQPYFIQNEVFHYEFVYFAWSQMLSFYVGIWFSWGKLNLRNEKNRLAAVRCFAKSGWFRATEVAPRWTGALTSQSASNSIQMAGKGAGGNQGGSCVVGKADLKVKAATTSEPSSQTAVKGKLLPSNLLGLAVGKKDTTPDDERDPFDPVRSRSASGYGFDGEEVIVIVNTSEEDAKEEDDGDSGSNHSHRGGSVPRIGNNSARGAR